MTKTQTTLNVERSNSGRLIAVHVPIVLPSDRDYYQLAAQAAGFTGSEVYRVRAARFVTRGAGNAKLLKSDKQRRKRHSKSKRYLSSILHLAPHKLSGFDVCPMAKACAQLCVNYNGKGQMRVEAFENMADSDLWLLDNIAEALQHPVHAARIGKTRLLKLAPELFAELLEQDLKRFVAYCAKHSRFPLCRPNGTSDIAWEATRFERFGNRTIFEQFPSVQFYDYTKLYRRAVNFARGLLPSNYDLTFSRDESNGAKARKIVDMGGRVAIVVRSKRMRKLWSGPLAKAGQEALRVACRSGIPGFEDVPTFNADLDDIRHQDPLPSVSALYAKGRAARSDSGFAVELN